MARGPGAQPPIPSPLFPSWAALAVGYALALAAAVACGVWVAPDHPIASVAVGHVAATLVIFGFGVGFSNSSFYDACWSLAPIGIAVAWVLHDEAAGPLGRQILAVALVSVWGLRLTGNFLRRWGGLGDEDWRYEDLRQKWGRLYPLVDLFGVHLFQTALVFGASLPLWPALSTPSRPLGWLDALGAAVILGAVAIETLADQQLWRFLASRPEPGTILSTGLWAWSRHPNYFGQMMFWWGLYLLALAADPGWWWTGAGALAITLLLVFISIPLMERRSLARRPGYAEHAEKVSALIPWPPRR